MIIILGKSMRPDNKYLSQSPPENAPSQTTDLDGQFLQREDTGQTVAHESQTFANAVPVQNLHPSTAPADKEVPRPKKNRALFYISILLSVAQILWFGSAAWQSTQALDASRLTQWLACAMLASTITIQFIYLYRKSEFNLASKKRLVFICLSVAPFVAYLACLGLMLTAIQFKDLSLSLGLLAVVALVREISFYTLILSTVGLDQVINKRMGIRKIISLRPLGLLFLAGIIAILLVGSPNSSQNGLAEQSQLKQARIDMSSYLTEKYGMQFNVNDVYFDKEIELNNGTKRIIATVSPVNDSSFSYSASALVSKDIDITSATLKDRVRYKEDFLGEYWKSGFEKSICSDIKSADTSLIITTCRVTHYSLSEDYNIALARYRGNIRPYAELNENERKSIKFSVTIESTDDDNLDHVLEHAHLLRNVRNIIKNTHSVGNIVYYANPIDEKADRLGYYGTTDVTSEAGNIPVEKLMFRQDAAESKKHPAISDVLYYNPDTRTFDLNKPI